MSIRKIKRLKLSELVDEKVKEIPEDELSKLISKNKMKMKNNSGCLYCKRKNITYCHSHTVPQFVLKNIATEGTLKTLNAILNLPVQKSESGVANAGVFKLICRECDSKIFNLYEDEKTMPKHLVINFYLKL